MPTRILKFALALSVVFIYYSNSYAEITLPLEVKDKLLNGIHDLYQLDYNKAKQNFRYVAKHYRDKPISYFYLAMVEWIKISEDINDETANKNFDYYINETMRIGQELYDNNKADSTDIFYYAGAMGFSARNLVKKQEWVKAYMLAKKALDLMNISIEKDPDNIDAYLGMGMYHYFADKIPSYLKDILKSFDIHGDSKKGIKELQSVMDKGLFAKTEAKIILLYIYTWFEKDISKAFKYTNELIEEFPNNLSFYHGKIYLLLGSKDYKAVEEVLNTYKKIVDKMNEQEQVRWIYKYYFYKGRSLFEQSKYADCMQYFRKVLEIRKKYLYTCRYCAWSFLRLGMCFDIAKKRDNALTLYKEVLKTDILGQTRDLAESFINKPFVKGDKRINPNEKKDASIP